MTKELRKKFILINMALVGTVLLIVFAVLCFQNYQRLEQDSMRVMERYFNDNGARPVPELEFDKKREWRNFPLMLSFCAVVDSNGELVSYQSDNLTVSEATVSPGCGGGAGQDGIQWKKQRNAERAGPAVSGAGTARDRCGLPLLTARRSTLRCVPF